MNKLSIYVAIAIIVIAGIIAFVIINSNPSEVEESLVIATVNGTEITRAAFEAEVNIVKKTLTNQGQEDQLTDPTFAYQIQQQVLDQMVNTELIKQEIAKAGLVISDENLQAQYDQIVENVGGEEAFVAQLADVNISDETFRENIKVQLLTQQYIASKISQEDTAVTEEEVEAFYNQSIEGQENVPTLDEVRGQLTTQLSQQKGDQLISALIEELRAASTIETFLTAPVVEEVVEETPAPAPAVEEAIEEAVEVPATQ